MKFRTLIGSLLIGCASMLLVSAQATNTFELASDQAVIRAARDQRSWDSQYTDPGAVFYHDGQFHMFRNGFNGWPAPVQIGYATSPDGVTWTDMSPDPVLRTDDVEFAGVAALASSALVQDDGTWVLYFYTWDSFSSNNAPGTIGRATASNPLEAWTVDPEPVLLPGGEGAWDSKMVNTPRVVRDGDEYVMYYAGFDEGGLASGAIGMATSPDGITWTKYDDPATTEAEFAESDPVLQSDSPSALIHQPNVVPTDDGWLMLFRRMERPEQTLITATSEDGIHWDANYDEPVWTIEDVPSSRGFYFTALASNEEGIYLYVEADQQGHTDIFVATDLVP